MNDKTPTLSSTIRLGVDSRIKELHTSLPGVIVDFDPDKQTAGVQLSIKRIIKSDDGMDISTYEIDIPKLINIPIIFPRGGGFSLTFPVKPGDECLVNFCERSIDRWHEFSGNQKPGARRFHSFSDAVAFVGLSSKPNKIPSFDPDNVQMKADSGDSQITVLGDGTMELKAVTKVTIDTPLTEITGDVNIMGNAQIDGTLDVVDVVTFLASLSVTGPVTFFAALVVTGVATFISAIMSAGKDIGGLHSHTQPDDSNGDSQPPTSGVT